MSSFRRIISSQQNGALSKGPKTPEGKRRSSANAFRHGLFAKTIVVHYESERNFKKLIQQHIDRYSPPEGGPLAEADLGLIEHMVAADWRMRRLWAIETSLLNDQISADDTEPDPLHRLAGAWSTLADTNKFINLSYCEARLQRAYYRALRTLQANLSKGKFTFRPDSANPLYVSLMQKLASFRSQLMRSHSVLPKQ